MSTGERFGYSPRSIHISFDSGNMGALLFRLLGFLLKLRGDSHVCTVEILTGGIDGSKMFNLGVRDGCSGKGGAFMMSSRVTTVSTYGIN